MKKINRKIDSMKDTPSEPYPQMFRTPVDPDKLDEPTVKNFERFYWYSNVAPQYLSERWVISL